MLSWSRLSRRWSPAYAAAIALVLIQVGIGIVFKISQTGGKYSFSQSSSITISEFLKFVLSTCFFYRECKRRPPTGLPSYERVSSDSESLSNAEKGHEDRSSIELDDSSPHRAPDAHLNGSANGTLAPKKTWRPFTMCIKTEVFVDTKYGFVFLALLYALINNSIFVLYKLADPGTIQLIRSGVTLITALVMLFALGTRIVKLQWMAIIMQICGLVVTQYHPGTGASYPFSTYTLLIGQTFLGAVAGVYNQSLCKKENASLHGDNMVLYAAGATVNLMIHITMKFVKDDEPNFFTGYGSWGAIMVILSNVFIGLAITAVYKYADALIKCLATSVSTGILLYLSPILFGVKFSFLVLPGTLVVFISTYLYVISSPPKDSAPPLAIPIPFPHPSRLKRILGFLSPNGRNPRLGLGISASLTIFFVAYLTKSSSVMRDQSLTGPKTTIITPGLSDTILESPFKNTLAYVRWNTYHPERAPALELYDPFFHTLHFSMPDHPREESLYGQTITHDSWGWAGVSYQAVADTMQLILDALDDSRGADINGLMFFHFDAWMDPMRFADEDFENIWFPDSEDPKFECFPNETIYTRLGWNSSLQTASVLASKEVKNANLGYVVDTNEYCVGWTDVFYIPRRFFHDFIVLSNIFHQADVYHEVAIPTIVQIIDQTRRVHPSRTILTRLADCWGNCCAVNATVTDVLWNRCGHRLDYQNGPVVQAHLDRLANEAYSLGDPLKPPI